MKKTEIAKAKNNELVYEYVNSYALLCLNSTSGRGVKQLSKHCEDLEKELIKRELLTEEDVRLLNM